MLYHLQDSRQRFDQELDDDLDWLRLDGAGIDEDDDEESAYIKEMSQRLNEELYPKAQLTQLQVCACRASCQQHAYIYVPASVGSGSGGNGSSSGSSGSSRAAMAGAAAAMAAMAAVAAAAAASAAAVAAAAAATAAAAANNAAKQ